MKHIQFEVMWNISNFWNTTLFVHALLKQCPSIWNNCETCVMNWYNRRMNGQLVKPLKDYMFKLWNTLKKPKHYWNTLHWFMKVMWKLNVELKQWKNPMVNLWNTMQEGHSSLNVLWNNNSSANLWNMHIQVKR
jgi:hypothetical protein